MSEPNVFDPMRIPMVAEAAKLTAGFNSDDGLAYMSMPNQMSVYQAPILPEPEAMVAHQGAVATLNALIDIVKQQLAGEVVAPMTLRHLSEADLLVVNQVLGEGEVSATIVGDDSINLVQIDIQETAFVGVWRVVALAQGVKVYDAIEVGTIPALIWQTAQQDAQVTHTPSPLPKELVNIPSIIHEIQSHSQASLAMQGQEGFANATPHVVNLTLLPLTEVDIAYIDDQLGTGRITILSRGYGNCRITNTLTAHAWRLVYYNSQDNVILNCIEVTDVPLVACASESDLQDTLERLVEVLALLESDA